MMIQNVIRLACACLFVTVTTLATPQLAAQPGDAGTTRLRVLSYNIHHCEGVDAKLDLERIAAVIRAAEPDLVALQEVDQRVRRSRSVDQPAELARLTGMKAVFGQNIPLEGGGYGNAVLSRLPIVRQQNHKLPNVDAGEQRGVLEVELDAPGDKQPLLFLATHLDHRRDDRERLASAKAIAELAAGQGERPMLLVGDLNATPDSAVMTEFGKSWRRANDEILPTIPVNQPARQIDYVMLRPAERWKVIDVKVIDEPVASDHLPILATVELLPGPKQ
jgi:endonuclease/exonuclease/phosphatase family metal-dependent hydrolase